MTPTTLRSKCCNAELTIFTGSEGTNHWICAHCGQAADPVERVSENMCPTGTPTAPRSKCCGEEAIKQAVQMATQLERDSWLNQKTNDHDARIRADEKQKVLDELESWLVDEERKKGIISEVDPIKRRAILMVNAHIEIRNDYRAELRAKVQEMKGKNAK